MKDRENKNKNGLKNSSGKSNTKEYGYRSENAPQEYLRGNVSGVNRDREVYNLLCDVFIKKAYSTIALNDALLSVADAHDRAYVTGIFYGVIEKSIQFDYIINKLSEKKPKNNIIIILKIGMYLLRYSNTPEYAAINRTVDLCKSVGKAGTAGFVNAVLRKSSSIDIFTEQYKSEADKLSVLYSYPVWAVKLLISQRGKIDTEKFLSYPKKEGTHIRRNINKYSKQEFEEMLSSAKKDADSRIEASKLGYYVPHGVMKNLPADSFTAQSYASMIAVQSFLNAGESVKKVLDLCGAPGGKSVYFKQLRPELSVLCCDKHPHKIKLIESYAKRMSVEIDRAVNDATVHRPEWNGVFDYVVCDVPCSGLGLVGSKPDIIINRKPEDIAELSKIQLDILTTAAGYVKAGGYLFYSTCTVLNEENTDIINKFLAANNEFELVHIENDIVSGNGTILLMPHTHGSDGFFIAKMKRKSVGER